MSTIVLPRCVADAFGVEPEAIALAGTEGRTYRSGTIVLRRGVANAPPRWEMRVLRTLRQDGFRVERPLRSIDGRWSVNGWTAWTFLEGRSATPADAAAVARATQAFHAALASVPYAPHLTARAGMADRAAWEDDALPESLPREIDAPLRRLAALRRPLAGLQKQVIHGDLNYHNILIAPGHDPGFIDFSPYWRPPEFAAAIAAYWLGPYQGATTVLRHFAAVRDLEQMLVRVAMRQLLRLIEMQALGWADEFVAAADVVCRLAE